MSARIGATYNVRPAAWERFRAETGTVSAWDRPQPLINIHSSTGWYMLAFPYRWWDPADLEVVPAEGPCCMGSERADYGTTALEGETEVALLVAALEGAP